MTSNEICSLIVSLDISPWWSEPREYTIARRTITSLDEYTLKFRDKEQFYEAVKSELMPKVEKDSVKYFGLVPTDVSLSKDGVFVRTLEKDKKALFQNVDYGDKAYSLNDLILFGMLKGGLKCFYECDKMRSNDSNYQIFFKDKLKYAGERLEIDAIKRTDYNYVLSELVKMRRYSEVARFLLRFLSSKMNEVPFDLIYEMFLKDVSSEEYTSIIKRNEDTESTEEKMYYYRPPYKED